MKKVNIIYIIVMSIAVIMFISCFVMRGALESIEDYGEEVSSDLDEAREDGEVDDVEGWGLIAEGSLAGLGALAGIGIMTMAFVTGIYAVLLVIFSSLARAFFKPQGIGLGVYRVLMAIVYILLALLVALFVSILLEGFNLFFFVCGLILTGMTVYCLVNTYSKRITQ